MSGITRIDVDLIAPRRGIHDLGGANPVEKYLRVKLDIAHRVAESVALFGWNVTIPDRNPMPRFRIWGRR